MTESTRGGERTDVPRDIPPLLGRDGTPHGAEITHEKLLQATHELLYERMDASASVSDICLRAGTNVAMVKYCFGKKAGLFDALVERVMSQVGEEVERLSRLDLPPEEKLRLHVDGLVRNYVRYPYLNRLMSDRLNVASNGGIGQMSNYFAVTARDLYKGLLADGQRLAGWREIDPTMFFFSIIGACEFVFSASAWLEHAFVTKLDEPFLETFIAHTTGLLLDGLRGSPDSS